MTAIITLCVAIAIGVSAWTVQTIKARHERANRLVRQAFDMLAIEDYRDSEAAKRLLVQAKPLGPNDTGYKVAYHEADALAHLADN